MNRAPEIEIMLQALEGDTLLLAKVIVTAATLLTQRTGPVEAGVLVRAAMAHATAVTAAPIPEPEPPPRAMSAHA